VIFVQKQGTDVSVQEAGATVDGALASTLAASRENVRSRANLSALPNAPAQQKVVQLGTLEAPSLALLRYWSKPAVVALALLVCALCSRQGLTLACVAAALTAALLSRQIFSPLQSLSSDAPGPAKLRLPRLLLEWGIVVALLSFLGFALKLDGLLPRRLMLNWFALTTALLWLGDHCSTRIAARAGNPGHRHIIIGANAVGVELARRVSLSVATGSFLGFFDFRSVERLPEHAREQFVGQCKDVAEFVRRHAIDAIYIALPMSNAPRIEDMLQEFRDSTASVYFVPDIFAFDLVQARCVEMNGIPMLAICDTPFHGMHAVRKRAMDIGLASLGLLVGWPLLLIAAIAVKLSSAGPILFKQRRYGLHGEEILVYKFRSMTVCEDGEVLVQAQARDARTTALGRFLRRTSLDELPQLFNVLAGTMSFVGPRPHAVAHNELYRKLISGYMIRHKVRPGMTGWAQVHGLRGETATVEQMRLRVEYDLDYLRHWSLWLDLKILLKTALIVIHGRNAH
jgi:putative colanic acid biosysnthesis UDP-glucose lipid carrier transferase